jgi:Cu/Ag efflux protein CusF
MWLRTPAPLAAMTAIAIAAGCTTPQAPGREYPLTGSIVAVKADRTEVTVNHDEVKGLMAPMTMRFAVKDPAVLSGLAIGDRITATLVVTDEEYFLKAIRRTGQPPAPGSVPAPPR